MDYDVYDVRGRYPALADGYAYLDGAAGTQVPYSVIRAIADAYAAGIGNVHGPFPASVRSDALVAEARGAVADLVGGVPEGVVLGPNMTTLTYRLAWALAREWRASDVVVVSRLDHDANVRPWLQAARLAGARVRWAEIDPATGELPVEQYDDLLDTDVRLVAVTAASNVLGTRPDVAAVAAKARAAGALIYVDGVHATPHVPVDVDALGADFYATSAYKWSGPHVGAVVADPALLEHVRPYKLTPAPDWVPERFETGTAAFADLAGTTAAVEHLAGLSAGNGNRRERLVRSMGMVEAYESELFERLIGGLRSIEGVTLYGAPTRRTPTAYFTVAGHTPQEVSKALAAARVNVWHGHSYAWEVTGVLGIRERGGAVRAGLVHYNDVHEVDRLLEVVSALARD